MQRKIQIMDEIAMARVLARMTHEIIERNRVVEDVCLLGIKSRGVPLAKRIAENVLKFEGKEVSVGSLDVTRNRDDLSDEQKKEIVAECEIPCDLKDKTVIIVDDVLYTGRTARAALECIFDFARPKAVHLAVLVDRGHRELPIRPDFVGKNVPTAERESVSVNLKEYDGVDQVYISEE